MSEGTIMGFAGSWGSGLGTLLIQTDDGKTDVVHCDNGPTVRALDDCFGDVITDNHTVNNEAIAGKRITYSVDDFGILEGFSPVDA